MIVGATNQVHLEIKLSDNLLKVIELILVKVKKYEEIGRLDKGYLLIGYLNKIYLIVRYWYYANTPYSELPKCIEEMLECSLDELKDKLKILPRDLYVDITQLLDEIKLIGIGINNYQVANFDTVNSGVFPDLQIS